MLIARRAVCPKIGWSADCNFSFKRPNNWSGETTQTILNFPCTKIPSNALLPCSSFRLKGSLTSSVKSGGFFRSQPLLYQPCRCQCPCSMRCFFRTLMLCSSVCQCLHASSSACFLCHCDRCLHHFRLQVEIFFLRHPVRLMPSFGCRCGFILCFLLACRVLFRAYRCPLVLHPNLESRGLCSTNGLRLCLCPQFVDFMQFAGSIRLCPLQACCLFSTKDFRFCPR